MNTEKDIEARLWDYIDGNCTPQEGLAIAQHIKEDEAWRAKYAELLNVHSLLQATELEQPSLRFTKNVLEEITKLHIAPATKTYINNKIIWSIGIFFITTIIGFLIYGVGQIDWATAENSKTLTGIDFTAIDYSRVFNNSVMTVVMLLNVILGLMFFDRYLSNKKRQWQRHTKGMGF